MLLPSFVSATPPSYLQRLALSARNTLESLKGILNDANALLQGKSPVSTLIDDHSVPPCFTSARPRRAFRFYAQSNAHLPARYIKTTPPPRAHNRSTPVRTRVCLPRRNMASKLAARLERVRLLSQEDLAALPNKTPTPSQGPIMDDQAAPGGGVALFPDATVAAEIAPSSSAYLDRENGTGAYCLNSVNCRSEELSRKEKPTVWRLPQQTQTLLVFSRHLNTLSPPPPLTPLSLPSHPSLISKLKLLMISLCGTSSHEFQWKSSCQSLLWRQASYISLVWAMSRKQMQMQLHSTRRSTTTSATRSLLYKRKLVHLKNALRNSKRRMSDKLWSSRNANETNSPGSTLQLCPRPAQPLPPGDLKTSELAAVHEKFTPIVGLSKYPYKFCSKDCMQDIALAFFDREQFWAREWDL